MHLVVSALLTGIRFTDGNLALQVIAKPSAASAAEEAARDHQSAPSQVAQLGRGVTDIDQPRDKFICKALDF